MLERADGVARQRRRGRPACRPTCCSTTSRWPRWPRPGRRRSRSCWPCPGSARSRPAATGRPAGAGRPAPGLGLTAAAGRPGGRPGGGSTVAPARQWPGYHPAVRFELVQHSGRRWRRSRRRSWTRASSANWRRCPSSAIPSCSNRRTAVIELWQRVRYAFAGDLSSAVKAVVDPEQLTWVEESTLDRTTHRTTFRIVPDHYGRMLEASGTIDLVPDGDRRCRHRPAGARRGDRARAAGRPQGRGRHHFRSAGAGRARGRPGRALDRRSERRVDDRSADRRRGGRPTAAARRSVGPGR